MFVWKAVIYSPSGFFWLVLGVASTQLLTLTVPYCGIISMFSQFPTVVIIRCRKTDIWASCTSTAVFLSDSYVCHQNNDHGETFPHVLSIQSIAIVNRNVGACVISHTQWQEHTSVISLCFKAGHYVSAAPSSHSDSEHASYTLYKHMDVGYVVVLKDNGKLPQLPRVWIHAWRMLLTLYLRREVWDFPRQWILVIKPPTRPLVELLLQLWLQVSQHAAQSE